MDSNVEIITTDLVTPLETQALSISPRIAADDVLAIFDRIKFYAAELARIKKLAEALVLAWVQENGNLVVGNGKHYAAVTERTTKCTNIPGAIEAILVKSGGSFEKLCEMLGSQPLKYGACKAILGDDWGLYFVVEEKQSLEEKTTKKLALIDEGFVKR